MLRTDTQRIEKSFQPKFINKKSEKLASKPWLRFDEPQVILIQGMRGAGKTATRSQESKKTFNS